MSACCDEDGYNSPHKDQLKKKKAYANIFNILPWKKKIWKFGWLNQYTPPPILTPPPPSYYSPPSPEESSRDSFVAGTNK